MSRRTGAADVIVVGGGIVGLAVAWRARRQGMSVTLLERGAIGRGASHVAAGMLAPVSELEFGESGRMVLELGLRSAQMWPAFASELEGISNLAVGLVRMGTMLLAGDEDEARELERQISFRESLGLPLERLRPSEARAREPALAPVVRMAAEARDDHSVDPRLVLAALQVACRSSGVELREQAPVARIERQGAGGSVTGVSMPGGDRVQLAAGGHVVVAAGAWVEQIEGLPAKARMPVRPVKGQIVRLRDPAGPGLLGRVLRFHGGYIVPRADGSYVLGATVEERGYELAPSAGGMYELLRDAHTLLPGVSELQIEELSVGLRPGTPDNLPAIGPGACSGLVWAGGHYRNGILLAPLTAELVVGVLMGERPDPLLDVCDPARFVGEDRPAAPGTEASPSLETQARRLTGRGVLS